MLGRPAGRTAPRASASSSSAATPLNLGGATGPLGYAFGTQNRDVTVFDAGTREVLETRPLGATVRWLSNEQRYWDGRSIWTYDFPGNRVVAVAIDPYSLTVTQTVQTGGAGPAHSLMLTPDLREAWLNLAGSNLLAVIDRASGTVVDRVETGEFP